jgi:hypothetical protein
MADPICRCVEHGRSHLRVLGRIRGSEREEVNKGGEIYVIRQGK